MDDSSWFSGWRTQVQALVDSVPGQPPSRICIVGIEDGGSATLQAYVLWPAQHRLITWVPSRDDAHSLLHATNVLDLRRDIVPTRADIGSSTYLEDRAWLADVTRHCARDGTTVTLAPRNGAPRG